MTKIMPATQAVNMDEPCFGLVERILQSPGFRGFRRYRLIFVIRNDAVAEFRQDLGPAKKFKALEFYIPGGVIQEQTGRIEIEHRVGELVEIAENLHIKPVELPDMCYSTSDLLNRYHDYRENRRKWREGISTFGPLGKMQRS